MFCPGGVGLKAGEVVGSLGPLGEAEAGQDDEAQSPTPRGRGAVKAGLGPRGVPALGPLISPYFPSQKADQPKEGSHRPP